MSSFEAAFNVLSFDRIASSLGSAWRQPSYQELRPKVSDFCTLEDRRRAPTSATEAERLQNIGLHLYVRCVHAISVRHAHNILQLA